MTFFAEHEKMKVWVFFEEIDGLCRTKKMNSLTGRQIE